MNSRHNHMLFQKFHTVSVSLSGKLYIYKSPEPLEVGDYVVVPVKGGLKSLVVKAIDEPVDWDAEYDYKWIVQKVDIESYLERQESDTKLKQVLQGAEAKKKQEELRAQLVECLSDESLKLLEQNL